MGLELLFGQLLQEIRKKRGLSQEELGFESGYHRTYISLLERGLKNPSLKTIFQLARALKIRPSEIIQRIENQMGHSDEGRRCAGVRTRDSLVYLHLGHSTRIEVLVDQRQVGVHVVVPIELFTLFVGIRNGDSDHPSLLISW